MTEHHEHVQPIRGRVVYYTELDDESGRDIMVEHVWLPGTEPCGNCGGHCNDPGMVGLNLGDEHTLMTAEEALMLANRITRAANLVLEGTEDAPDLERDMARFAAATTTEGDNS